MPDDKAPNFVLGNEFPDAQTQVVEASAAIAAGDLLKVTGVNADGQLRVAKQTADTAARFACLYAAAAGKMTEALLRGTTKVTFGTGVTPGESGKPKANKIVSNATGASGPACCIVISDGNAADDEGLIYFDGAMN